MLLKKVVLLGKVQVYGRSVGMYSHAGAWEREVITDKYS